MAEQQTFKWYVLKAISGKEGKVKEYIEAACKASPDYAQYVSQVLIPTEKVVQLRNGKRVIKERTYLPGYVLVEAIVTDASYPLLRNVPNVLGFLSDNKKTAMPTPVRQEEINYMIGKRDGDEDVATVVPEVEFLVGETVKVVDGPFSGFNGEIDEVSREKGKLKVLVTVFGQKTPLELGFNQVVKE